MTAILKAYPAADNAENPLDNRQDVIRLLLNGILAKIDAARDAEQRGALVEKGFYLGRATGIVDALRNMLDTRKGDQTALDLDTVYNHVDLCLQAATGSNSDHYLDEAAEIIENLSIGCNFIPEEAMPASVSQMNA